MCNTAAHIVDRIIPSVPVRQWVLSLPLDVRVRAAYDARFLTEIIRVFAQALGDRHRAWARSIALDESEFAAITFVQRFGSSLNLNVHLHVVVVDGVFSRANDSELAFTPATPPTRAEMTGVIQKVRKRIAKLLSKTAEEIQSPLAACARIALGAGDVRAISVDGADDEPHAAPPDRHDGGAVEEAHYNLEASVRIAADDDFGREHLLRYCARPPLSLARLTELPHGKFGYRIKKLRNHRSKVRVMTPLELLARLAALVPPPRHPLVRFHGAFAPRSSWRKSVVPKPPSQTPSHSHDHHKQRSSDKASSPTRRSPPAPPPTTTASTRQSPTPGLVAETELLTPNTLSVRHWERLHHGALLATSARIDWPTLMSRTFDADVLECPRCAGRLRILAIVDDENLAAKIIDELAIPRAPPKSRARDPATLDHDPNADEP